MTEYTEDEDSKKLWAAWMHRKGGVHDMAFTNGTGPRMHHVAFWVPTPLNIIDLLDLMSTSGYVANIERGPGRHGISNAFFLYVLDPDGHRIEIYCSDYQTVDPDLEPIKWDLKDPQRQTLWGAPAPESWFKHGADFVGVEQKDSALKGDADHRAMTLICRGRRRRRDGGLRHAFSPAGPPMAAPITAAITDAGAIALNHAFPQWPTLFDAVQADGLADLTAAAEGAAPTHRTIEFEMVLPNARRILCVGVNFPDRNAEYKDGSDLPKHMSLFPRFASGFTGHDRPLIRPPESPQLDYEGEVAIVIGKGGRRIAEADAYGHIAALSICNEGTIRDWVRHAKFNVTQGKNWDRSGAIGPWLTPFADPGQLDDARIITRVNGEVRQDDTLNRMMFPIRRQIAYISTFMALQPGDVIVTGTPTGAGARFDPPRFLAPGDVVEVEVNTIGVLRNTVEDEAQ